MSPSGSYDQIVVADAQAVVPALFDRFDLIVAWQVLEHFRDLCGAADAFRHYAKEGGWFVACLSGRYAVFAIANRLLPEAVGRGLVARLMRRPVDTIFPAYYDHCDDRGLHNAFAGWDELHVIPLWRGADYFDRFPPTAVAVSPLRGLDHPARIQQPGDPLRRRRSKGRRRRMTDPALAHCGFLMTLAMWSTIDLATAPQL